MNALTSSLGRDSSFLQKRTGEDLQLEDFSMLGGFDLGRVGLEFSLRTFSLEEGASTRLSLVPPTLQASVEMASPAVLDAGAAGDALAALALGEVPGLVHIADSLGWGDSGRAFMASDFASAGTSVAALAKLQHGLADIFVEAQLQVAGQPGVGREAVLENFVSSNKVARTGNGYVAIDAVAADGDGAALLAELESLGLERGASYGRLAGGLMPIDALDELAALDLLAFARPVYATTEVGVTTSQNVVSMNGDYVQALGIDGSGVTIGILSDSFATRVSPLTTYVQDMANGDLPAAGVNILADYTAAGTIDEGRGMAQLIHDMAPGASLAFHTAFVSAADFAQGIIDLVNAGADIVVDDIRYFAEPFFQDGIIAQAVDTAVDMGAMYFASAGNYGLRSYSSAEWRPSGQFVSSGGRTYELYDFNPGASIDTIQSITKSGTAATTYIFNWDQPNFSVSGGTGAQTEMQLFLHNGTSYATTASNNIGGDAIDLVQSGSTTFTGIAIGLQVGHAAPGMFQYVTIGGGFTINEYQTNSGSSFGHSNAAGALSVGASDWVDSGRFGTFPISGESFPYLEDFSSRGDIPILFDTAGNRLASPEYRSTVDFTAGDGGNTSFFGSDASYDADTQPNFYGTSAAAPNAAAVAALLKDAFPAATNAQIVEAMRATALDVQLTYLNTQIGDGADNRSGAGLIQADQAYNYLSEVMAPDQTLTAGQVAIVQYSTDDADDPHVGGVQNMARDSLSFVIFDGVTAGTQIHFTDRTWTHSGSVLNSGTFSNSGADGTYTWTASTDLAAGTVITINEAELTASGMELTDTGEAVYVYQGAANTPVRFLGAIEIADGNDIFTASLTNTGLTAGVNAFGIAEDNGSFGERTWNHQLSTLLQNIVNHANWHTNENSPQANHVEGTNLFVAPDHQLWMAGISGGHGLMTVNHDSTQNGGASYNQQHYLQNSFDDLGGDISTQRFWSPTHILFDTVGNKYFVVDSSGSHDRILQGNISDLLTNPGVHPAMTILWEDSPDATQDGDGITGMQLDVANGHVYFTADNKLLRVGFNSADQTAVTLVDFGTDTDSGVKNFANEFVLDLANNRAFVIQTESFNDFIESPPGSGNFIVGTTMYQNSIHLVSNLSTTPTHTQLDFTEAFDDDDNAYGDQLNEFDNLKGRITDIELNKSTGEIWFTTVQLNDGTDGSVGGIYKATLSGNTLTVVQIYTEGNATNQNFLHIHIDEETGHYYVSSQEPGESGQHAIYRGSLSATPGTAPTLYADVGNINDMTPRDMTLESAPTLTGTDAATEVTEASSAPASGDTAKVTLFSGVTASDIDTSGGDELAGAIVRISDNFLRETSTTAGHAVSQDVLTINNLTSGTIAGSGITFSYDSATGVMTLSGPGTVAEYKAALELVQFHTGGDNPTNDGTNTVRTISASVFDGLLYSDEISATVSVTGINDAPVNSVGLNDSGSEDSGIAVTGLAVADADASPSDEDITVTLNVTNGTLTVASIGGGVMLADVTGNGTATVTITATQNEINTTFAGTNGVTFNPAAHYNGTATLTITTNDLGNNGNDPGVSGTGTTEQDVDVKSILISEVNDAPTVAGDGTESAATILEDVPSATGQTVASLFGGQFSDALDQQFVSGTNPTGSVSDSFAGIAITANGSAAATGQWQYFNGTAWVDIGAASLDSAITLNSGTAIRFNPALNFNGAAPTLTARLIESGGAAITDGGAVDLNPAPPTFGTGSVYSAGSVVLSQTVTAVNDAPVHTINGAQTINEGGAATFSVAGTLPISVADVDAGGADLTTTVSAVDGVFAVGAVMAGLVVTGEGTNTLTLVGTAAEINDALDGLVYTPPTNANGTRTITVTTNDGGATGQDPGLTGTGSSEEDVDQFDVTIQSVNDEPSGADFTISLNEDGSTGFDSSSFGFDDSIDGDAIAGVVLTILPTTGDLYLDGVAIAVSGTFVTKADLDAGKLTYQPDANDNGTGYATFTFQVRDDGGTANGGVDTDQSPNIVTFDVNPINDAPVNAVPLATQTFNEDGTLTFNAANSNLISVSDVDAGAGNLTVTLSIQTGGLTLSTVTGLTFTTGDGAGDSTMTFSGTAAAINAALDGLVYAPGANYNGDRTLTITTNDLGATGADPGSSGDGTSEQDSDTISIDVTAINDAPVVSGDGTEEAAPIIEDMPTTGETVSSLFGGQYSDSADAQFSLSNPGGSSSGSFSGIAVVANGSTAATGQWQYFNTSTSSWVNIGSVSTASALVIGSGTSIRFNPALDFSGSAPTLTAHLIDNSLGFGITFGQMVDLSTPGATGGTTAYSTGTVVLSQDVTASNVAPAVDLDADDSNKVGTGFDATYTEGGAAAAISDTDVSITDADAGDDIISATITITNPEAGDLLSLVGALPPTISVDPASTNSMVVLLAAPGTSAADFEAAIEQITFSNTLDNPTDLGTNTARSITVTVHDGSATSAAATTTITVVGQNDDPTLTGLAGDTVNFFEDSTTPVLIDAGGDALIGDVDSANFGGGTLTVSITDGADAANDVLGISDVGNVTLVGSSVRVSGIEIGTLTGSGDNGNALVITLNSSATAATLTELVGALNYLNTDTIDPAPYFKDVTVTLADGDGGSVSAVSEVIAQPVNDAPVLVGSAGTISYTENGAPVAIDGAITVNDVDDEVLAAQVQITNGQPGDVLTFVNDDSTLYGNIAIEVGSTATVLNLRSADGSATFAQWENALRSITYHSTSDNPSTTDRTIAFIVNDGNLFSDYQYRTIAVTAVNDAPALGVQDNSVNGTEDSDLVFSTANSNAITVDDVDDTSLTVTLTVISGTLTLSGSAGLSVTGDGTGSVELIGSAANINVALDGLVYRGSLNFEGGDTLSIIVDDGDATDSDSIAITLADDGIVHGDSGNNVFTGTTQRDVFYLQQGGNDTVNGLAGSDTFYFGAAYTTADEVNAGDGNDSIILQGDYSDGVTVGTITGLESISLAPGNFTSFGDTANNFYDYALTTTDANVAAGSFLKINGFLLRAGEDFTFDGSAETDGTFSLFAGFGTDTLIGGAKNDFFLFGQDGRFAAGDTVVGGAGYDSFYLRGDYTLDFNAPELADTFSEIESITMASALDTQFFGGGDNEFDYSITWNDAMLASGQTITINGSRLLSNETMTFIGSSELGGHFRIFAGAGDDDLRGGTGNDLILGGRGADNMYGGGGNDVFRYDNVLDSTSSGRDGIQDFSLGDRIDLGRIDARSGTAANEAFTFIGNAAFAGTGASSAGQLRFENVSGPIWLVQGDTDGDGVSDLEIIVVITDADPITTTDFIL